MQERFLVATVPLGLPSYAVTYVFPIYTMQERFLVAVVLAVVPLVLTSHGGSNVIDSLLRGLTEMACNLLILNDESEP